MRLLGLLVFASVVPGCGFTIENGGAGDDGPGSGSGDEPDASVTPVSRRCTTTDPTLRLCIDFDDAADLSSDGSGLAHPVTGENLTPMTRAAEQAVSVDATSRLYVPETPDLDISDNLTVSLWVMIDPAGRPTTTTERWLFDNNTQYFASLRSASVGNTLKCGSATAGVEARVLPDNAWHHIACTYEPDQMRLYIDGALAGCEETSNRKIPITGTSGFAVGANVGGSASALTFSDPLIGGLDNVQVFARTWEDSELCAAAGHTNCNTRCPEEFEGPGGGGGGPGGG